MTPTPNDAPPTTEVAAPEAAAPDATPDAGPPIRPKRPLFRRRPKDAPGATDAPVEDAPLPEIDSDQPTEVVLLPPQPPLNPGRMHRERRRLMGRRQETVYHLGGLAFELFRRDMLDPSVMRRRAEEVADIDRAVLAIDEELAALDETRRARREERNAARREARGRQREPSGYCLSCGAPYHDPVNFCANCGSPVVQSGATEIIETPPVGEGQE